MQVQKLNSTDPVLLSRLQDLYAEVFDEDWKKPPAKHLEGLLKKDSLLFFVVIEDEELIGGLTAHLIPNIHYEHPEVFVYDIAVKESWQRKGVGALLLKALIEYSREQGYLEVFIPADKEAQQAVSFYRKMGGIETEVFHYSFTL